MNEMFAIDKIKELIEASSSYVLEAGAGSGKTYTLIQTINYLIENKGSLMKADNRRIVCITYTNVAKNEVIDRLENNPLVLVLTIHEFLWDCIKPYNKQLIVELEKLNTLFHEKDPDKYELGLVERISKVTYDDSGYRDFERGKLHHDDVISISSQMLKNYPQLTRILAQKYPYILIDEYQDTAPETIEGVVDGLLERHKPKVVLGFYGDSYQKIYDEGVGSLNTYCDNGKLILVTKNENYRSSNNVVKLLNKVRENIVQVIPEGVSRLEGSVKFINCINYPPVPSKGKRAYEKSLEPIKEENFNRVISSLQEQGWNFQEDSSDKILIIANSRVSQRGGFGNIYKIFSTRYGEGAKEQFLKRENPIGTYFLGRIDKKTSKERETGIEHLALFWSKKEYNNVIRFLRRNGNPHFLASHVDKKSIEDKLNRLIEIRETGTIKEVFDFCNENKISSYSDRIVKYIARISTDLDQLPEGKDKDRVRKDQIFFNSLMAVSYSEMKSAFKHIQDQTVFSTKHGTKGEEYRNVLVVIDDTSWKAKYNFENFFNDTDNNEDRKLRTRNLFYVSCSRAKENLVVLALSTMGEGAMQKVANWFEAQNITTL